MNNYETILEKLYDKYSAMLYGIALEISPSAKEADFILVKAFQQIPIQNLAVKSSCMLCITLIKILIQTAQHEWHIGEPKSSFRLKRFQNTPLLHQIFCEQTGFKNYCQENKVSTPEAMKQIRNEWSLLQSPKSVMTDTLPKDLMILNEHG